ncbi:hypothetical protein FACS18942_08400 [Planctomycetales bacterium]|nr:hypothetical protein FACS18942_08400 [Planctomycetales bacterium]
MTYSFNESKVVQRSLEWRNGFASAAHEAVDMFIQRLQEDSPTLGQEETSQVILHLLGWESVQSEVDEVREIEINKPYFWKEWAETDAGPRFSVSTSAMLSFYYPEKCSEPCL